MAAPAVGSTVFVPLASGAFTPATVTANLSSSTYAGQPTYTVTAVAFMPVAGRTGLEPLTSTLTVYVDRPTALGFAPPLASQPAPTVASAV